MHKVVLNMYNTCYAALLTALLRTSASIAKRKVHPFKKFNNDAASLNVLLHIIAMHGSKQKEKNLLSRAEFARGAN